MLFFFFLVSKGSESGREARPQSLRWTRTSRAGVSASQLDLSNSLGDNLSVGAAQATEPFSA